jgi:hypothetical protein
VKRSSYGPPHYAAALSDLLSFRLFSIQIFFSPLFSITLSLYYFLNVRDQVSHSYRTTRKIKFWVLQFLCF